MRTSALVTAYIQATLFLALGIRCVTSWLQTRDKRSAHLAIATSLWGINSLMSALSTTIWDTTLNEQPPRAWSIASSIIIYLATFAFLLFLSDFIKFPTAIKGLVVLATLFNIVLSFIERQEFTFKLTERGFEQIPIPGVNNPIPYRAYLWYVIIYLAVVFGVLGISFLVYGFRVLGLARLRMVSIGVGFTLLFVVIGLLPLLIFGGFGRAAATNLLNVVRYMALASAPLLFIGFAPPKAIARRVGDPAAAEAR